MKGHRVERKFMPSLALAGVAAVLLALAAMPDAAAATNSVQIAPAPPCPTDSQIAMDIVSCWPGQGNASDVVDGNDGTLENGTTFAPGAVEQAFSFDGVDDGVRIPDDPSLHLSQFTVSAWVRLDALPDQYKNIVTKGVVGNVASDAPGNNYNYAIWLYPDDRITAGFEEQDGTNHVVSTVSEFTIGDFYHIALTYDGIAVKVYINGVLEGELVTSAAPDLSTTDVMIGNTVKESGFCCSNDVWDGLIDEVKIFDRALDASEVKSEFLRISQNQTISPVGGIVEILGGRSDPPRAGSPSTAVGYSVFALAGAAATVLALVPGAWYARRRNRARRIRP